MHIVDFGREARVRYAAARCGFYVMQTRGAEQKRREKSGVGSYVLLNQFTNDVALAAATLDDIEAFLKSHQQQRQHLH